VVVNPARVDDLEGRRASIRSALADAGWPDPAWVETTPEDPGTGQTRAAVEAGAEVVFVLGGDGTVMAAVAGMTELAEAGGSRRAALAVLPAGTGNLLARNLGLPDDAGAGVRLATEGGRRQIDVARLIDDTCGHPFVVMAGMGFDAAMVDGVPAPVKRAFGWPAYVLSGLRHVYRRRFDVTVVIDGRPPVRRRVTSVVIGNVGRLQGGVRLLAAASPDDGVLDVGLLRPKGFTGWGALATGLLLGRRIPLGMEVLRGSRIDVRTPHEQPRQVDGDLVEPGTRLLVEVLPGLLELCVPRDGERGDLRPDGQAA
jgi:diacylglycerol kinase family enzyme